MPARTILLLHGSAGGYGADRQLYVLATGLDPARYRPVVVLPQRGELAPRLEAAGVEVQLAPVAVLKRSLLKGRRVAATAALARRSAGDLARLAFDRKAALLHTNTSTVLGAQGAARRAAIPHVVHLREIYRGAGGRAGAALWPLLRRRLLQADALVCVSGLVAEQVEGCGGASVLHDAVPHVPALPPRTLARSYLGIESDRFVVATIGRISDWKGQDVLARALAEPALAGAGAVALVAGDAARGQEYFERRLEELRDELGLGDRLRLLGFREDVETVLAAADALVVPSPHPEAFPNSALEGAVASLPVVATDNGGQRELIRDGVTGRLVPPGDHAALAEALRTLVDDPRAARRLGEAAAADVRARFGAGPMLEALQDTYDRVLHGARRTAWLLPGKSLRVSHPPASQLRLARLEASLRELGYDPVVVPFRGILAGVRLLPLALLRRPRLVLTNAAVYAPVLGALKRLLGRRLLAVVDVMGLHSLEIDQALHPAWLRPAVRRIWLTLEAMMCRRADLVLAVNDRHAALVRRRYRPAGVHTLRDAAEPELAEIPAADRAALGIREDAVAVGFVGALIYSRLDPLLDAWEEVERRSLDACLVVVGDGPDLERYRARAAARGWLGRSVHLLGARPRPEALAVLRACDVAVSDCWSEAGFPFKLYEYMALGLPIVTEGKAQTSEVLAHGRDALFFGSPDELASRIVELAGDRALRARLGAAARQTFAAAHTLEHRRRELAALLDGGPPEPPARVREQPRLVSVIVPVRNGERFIGDQLDALAAQAYRGAWEVVVVDNGCTDRTIEVVESRRGRLPRLTIADARARRGLNYARNRGAAAASGELLCFCDADDVVARGWLEALVEAAAASDLVGGTSEHTALNELASRASLGLGPRDGLLAYPEYLPYVSGGNCAVWADVARELGWDEAFRFGSSDMEFSWRAHFASFRLAYEPRAVIHARHRGSAAAMARQYFAYGKSGPQLYRRFRAYGMPRDGRRTVVRKWKRLGRTAPDLLRSPKGRRTWLRLAAVSAGRLVGSARWRVLYL